MDIAVIVPSYNRADLVGETLASILGQSYPPAEIVVVDDGSSDNTEAVVARYATVKYLRIRNAGECAARNAGVAVTTAPWVAFCDSDDLWHPDKLKLQAEVCEKFSGVHYCFTDFRTVIDRVWSEPSKFDTSPRGTGTCRRKKWVPVCLLWTTTCCPTASAPTDFSLDAHDETGFFRGCGSVE